MAEPALTAVRRALRGPRAHRLPVRVHGIPLRFHADQARLLRHAGHRLAHLAGGRATVPGRTMDCRFTIPGDGGWRTLRSAYAITSRFEAFPGVDASFGTLAGFAACLLGESCLLVIEAATNDCACVLRRGPDRQLLHLDLVMHVLLIEWLRGAGRFFIHASGIRRPDGAILFAGPSGAGKSTAALLALQHGGAFMGDDLLMLGAARTGVDAFACVEEVKIRPDMAGRFNELAGLSPAIPPGAEPAVRFEFGGRFRAPVARRARVARVYFLEPAGALTPLPAAEALPLLMRHSFFHGRPDATQAHFDLLCRLASSAACWRVGREHLDRHLGAILGPRA